MSEGPDDIESLRRLVGDQAAVIERRQKRVAELESQLRQAVGEVARFRRRGELKRSEREKKSPDRPKGHKAEYRPVPEAVDRQEAVPLEGCPHCGGSVGHVRECVQFIEEIPPAKPVTVKVTTRSPVPQSPRQTDGPAARLPGRTRR